MTVNAADIVEIKQLVARYNQAIDKGDGDTYAACFVESGVLDAAGRVIEGKDALVQFAAEFRKTVRCPRHLTHNVLVDFGDDKATASAYVQMWDSMGDPPVMTLAVSGVYQDHLIKEAGSWRFTRRILTIDL
jgi:uncharacterized protein (TIGR02246 family)